MNTSYQRLNLTELVDISSERDNTDFDFFILKFFYLFKFVGSTGSGINVHSRIENLCCNRPDLSLIPFVAYPL